MKRVMWFLLVVGLLSPILLAKQAQGHGVKKGSKTLVSTNRTCVTPSKDRVTKKYKTLYTLRGTPTPQKAPSDHWHYSTSRQTLRPFDDEFRTECLTTKTVCRQWKYYHTTCGRTNSERDVECNRSAPPWDGYDLTATSIRYWVMLNDTDDCWEEIVY